MLCLATGTATTLDTVPPDSRAPHRARRYLFRSFDGSGASLRTRGAPLARSSGLGDPGHAPYRASTQSPET